MAAAPYHICIGLIVCAGGAASAQEAAIDQAPSYTRDVRPILSKNCFACHGPDAEARKAKLRLDQPGKIQTSKLLTRITHLDPDEIMPRTLPD